MRFGRRNKFKPRGNGEAGRGGGAAAVAAALSNEESDFSAGETGQGADVQLRGETSGGTVPSDDPTQHVLNALARFKRELPDSSDNSRSKLWPDACMNELIACVEIALEQSWSDFVKPLADTGRVLQTYENAGTPGHCVSFLGDAHEILCLMVGDIIVDTIRPEANEQWLTCYRNALDAIETAGLTLAQDDQDVSQSEKEGGAVGQEQAYDATNSVHEQQKMPLEVVSNSSSKWSETEELPALDDLPPLEELAEMGIEVSADTLGGDPGPETSEPPPEQSEQPDLLSSLENVTYLDTGAASSPDESMDSEPDSLDDDSPEPDAPESPQQEELTDSEPPAAEPGRMVIEILDCLCDELGQVSSLSGGDRDRSIERITGGITTLKREAKNSNFTAAGKLCEFMEEAGRLAFKEDGAPSQRYIELGYAFCGVYIEATDDDGSASVEAWENECQALIEELKSEASASAPPEEQSDESAETTEVEKPPVIDDAVLEKLEAEVDAAQAAMESEQAQDDPPTDAASELGEPGVDTEPASDDSDSLQEETPPPTGELDTSALDTQSDESESESESEIESETELGDESKLETELETEPEQEPSQIQDTAPADHSDEPSRSFLESAQRADSAGDTGRAKYFALQAAAEIAKEEVNIAERYLHEAEVRLRESWKAAEDARKQVKEGENSVVKAATEVVSGETSLGTSKEGVAQAIQEHEDVEAHVQELEDQINALQARFAMEKEKLETADRFRQAARQEEENAIQRIEELTQREADARMELEATRQQVKDLHRATNDIESNMEEARESLTQKKNSMVGIDQIIEQLCGNEKPGENPDTLLF